MPFRIVLSFLIFSHIKLYSQYYDSIPQGYQFTLECQVKATPVKDQGNSGYCWSYCTLSMLESELISMEIGEYDLSEMFVVRNCYLEKARKYVRMHGLINFSDGGAMYDVIDVWNKFGLVPDEALKYREGRLASDTVNILLKNFIDEKIKKKEGLSDNCEKQIFVLLDSCFGRMPENFYYKGEEYSPGSFARSLSLNSGNYIVITSFSHRPFYKKIALEVPDNWAWGEAYNLPLDELKDVLRESLKRNYSFAWSGDVTEPGFSFSMGIAIVPEKDSIGFSKREKTLRTRKDKEGHCFDKPGKEKEITQELRQKAYDSYQTTDDHGLHITGMAKDQLGNIYYLAKNSWGTDNLYRGYLYISEPYLLYKTTSILININALPENIKTKMNLSHR